MTGLHVGTRVVGYIRVSTSRQTDSGISIGAQRARIEAYAGLYDLLLVDVIVDAGESAKTLNRPGLTRALDMLESGEVEALLVVKLDRLTRSVRDLCLLVERHFSCEGRSLMSVSEQIDTRTAAGRLVLNVLGAVSQWERETIGERTSAAMSHKRQQGGYVGGRVPYGMQVVEGVLVEHEGEQEVIRQAKALRSAGLSLRKVAVELERAGFLTRKGGSWKATQVKRLVDDK